MSGESQQVPESKPDPSVFTTEGIERANVAERDYVDGRIAVLLERLRGIDRATELLNETINRTPTDIQKEILHLRELSEEKFDSVQKQFDERDVRTERESQDNTVKVDAAFAAQKDSARASEKTLLDAVAKIEVNFEKSILKLEGALGTQIKAQADKIEDVKTSVSENRQAINSINDRQTGGRELITEHRGTTNYVTGLIAFGIAVAAFFGFQAINNDPATPDPIIVEVPATP